MNGNDTIQIGPRKLQLDEAKICQLMAVLAEIWPDVKPSRPKLTLLQGGKGTVTSAALEVKQ
ncbi:hypothetical protein GCM10007862_07120 [Dyella lipolytica]|uniref:Uncharacterized protein n=1 Tax=Dyella lipolytica TaxID=1867835 RepID=A0ABW8IYM6_9GAMM|nr:hypothetical protein [Dyella lipolytica]GLQ45661.1 hypothetical protein GCM10007862_07120 [Dyella lipolytica]